MPKRILSIGNCGRDDSHISAVLQKHFGAAIDSADSASQAIASLQQTTYDLVLVNRVFDADGDSGLKFIKQLKNNPETKTIPIMLISNYAEAQEEAKAAGALPGFGKNQVGKPQLAEHLKQYLRG